MKKIIALCVIASMLFSGCYNGKGSLPKATETKPVTAAPSPMLDSLKSAKTIKVSEAIISLGKKYTISADGAVIGTVTGNFIHLLGDTFEMKDTKGNLVATEKQIKRWGVKANRQAEFDDANGNTEGYFTETVFQDLLNPGYVFHFYNPDKKEIGMSDQIVLSLLKKNVMTNTDGSKAYVVNKQLNLIRDEYDITVKDSSSIRPDMAVFMVCIEDAIKDAAKDAAKKAQKIKKKKK